MTVHRINRAEIHLQVHAPEVAGDLIERCSELHARAIAPLIDRICSELSGPDRIDRIDRLELDLGALTVDDFEGELLRKLEASLRSALKQTLAQREAVDRRRSAIELLETFASLGNLPWWAASTGDPVAAAISTLVDDDPQALLVLLHQLAADRPGLTRLARHADERAFTALVTQRWPTPGPALLAAVRTLERALPDERPILRGALLAAIAGPDHEAARVLPSMLLELAVARDWPTKDLHARLEPVARLPDLPALLRETFLALGLPPVAVDVTTTLPRPEPEQNSIDDSHPLPVKPEATIADTLVTPAGPTGASAPIAAVHTAIEPSAAAATPASIPTSTASPTAGTADRTIPEPRLPPVATARTSDSVHARPSPRTTRSPAPTQRRTPHQQAARDRALARIDGLHVEDAGLVLLWPFLDRLCQRCGLVDEQRRFVDEPAQHRAAALFETIVTGELAPPEFRLPLAKLLAGLTPEASLMLAAPLDPAWREECDRLLVAVVGHAPALGELDPPGFRAGYLRRAAALHVHDGAWTLQVERAAHDVVLDRLPWSWSWVKLPWMPDTLRVEW